MLEPTKSRLLLGALLVFLALPLAAQTNAPGGAVRVADLIGLPIVDDSKVALGRVRGVAKTDDGKIELLLPLGGIFGFGERLVAVPIESAALIDGAIAIADVPPDRYQKSRTWYGSGSEQLAPTETVSISRR